MEIRNCFPLKGNYNSSYQNIWKVVKAFYLKGNLES